MQNLFQQVTELIKQDDRIFTSEGVLLRNKLVEFEVFMDIMKRAVDYYIKGSYVQRAKICEIFFLNIILDKQKGLTIKVKPMFDNLFVLCGGGLRGNGGQSVGDNNG